MLSSENNIARLIISEGCLRALVFYSLVVPLRMFWEAHMSYKKSSVNKLETIIVKLYLIIKLI